MIAAAFKGQNMKPFLIGMLLLLINRSEAASELATVAEPYRAEIAGWGSFVLKAEIKEEWHGQSIGADEAAYAITQILEADGDLSEEEKSAKAKEIEAGFARLKSGAQFHQTMTVTANLPEGMAFISTSDGVPAGEPDAKPILVGSKGRHVLLTSSSVIAYYPSANDVAIIEPDRIAGDILTDPWFPNVFPLQDLLHQRGDTSATTEEVEDYLLILTSKCVVQVRPTSGTLENAAIVCPEMNRFRAYGNYGGKMGENLPDVLMRADYSDNMLTNLTTTNRLRILEVERAQVDPLALAAEVVVEEGALIMSRGVWGGRRTSRPMRLSEFAQGLSERDLVALPHPSP